MIVENFNLLSLFHHDFFLDRRHSRRRRNKRTDQDCLCHKFPSTTSSKKQHKNASKRANVWVTLELMLASTVVTVKMSTVDGGGGGKATRNDRCAIKHSFKLALAAFRRSVCFPRSFMLASTLTRFECKSNFNTARMHGCGDSIAAIHMYRYMMLTAAPRIFQSFRVPISPPKK